MLKPVVDLNKYSGLFLPATYSRSTIGLSLATYDAQQTTLQPPGWFSGALLDLQRDLDSNPVATDALLSLIEIPPHEEQLSHQARLLLRQGTEDVLRAR